MIQIYWLLIYFMGDSVELHKQLDLGYAQFFDIFSWHFFTAERLLCINAMHICYAHIWK